MKRLFAVFAVWATLGGAISAAASEDSGLNYMVPVAAESTERPMLPDYLFADGSGLPVHLSRYRGQVVILTFWASACGPCLKQMVFLDRLQMNLRQLAVVAISEDQGGIAQIKATLARQRLNFLKPFGDPSEAMAGQAGIRGLPTSIIVDRYGRQFLRVEGPYQWDTPLIEAQLRKLMSEP